ncbi:MAG: hypothetical protein Q8M76_02560 [Spirochaetaceae bacterium]|nr:hypothetical protein [Spirochaetaceae bacterium]
MANSKGTIESKDSGKKGIVAAETASGDELQPCTQPQAAEAARLNALDEACDDSVK